MLRPQKEETTTGPRRRVSPYSVTSTGPEVHGVCGVRVLSSINNLIKHAPILGSRRSAAIIPAPASPLSHGANCSLPPGDHPVTWRT